MHRPLLWSVSVLSAVTLLSAPAVHADEKETVDTAPLPTVPIQGAVDPQTDDQESVAVPETSPTPETGTQATAHAADDEASTSESLDAEPRTAQPSHEATAVPEATPTTAASQAAAEPEAPVEKVKVIVETTDRPALARADRQDSEAFNQALETADADVLHSFNAISADLATQGIHLTLDDHFYGGFAGFSTTVNPEDIEQIKRLKQVQNVTVQRTLTPMPVVEPEMIFSGDLVGLTAEEREQIPYKGENIIVSVIDSGIDPDHRDLTLSDDIEKRYDEAAMTSAITELGLPGRWYSNKVPYGYNYADETQNVKSMNGVHGQHVSGIIGANGNPEDGGIVGVAPHVQILAMKVFGNGTNDSTTTEDIYIRAIDDSIKLGADVLNLSLGGPAGFNQDSNAPLERTLALARSKGILPVIAMGNDRNITQGLPENSTTANPDTSLASSPGLSSHALTVGSIDNIRQMLPIVRAEVGGQAYQFKSQTASGKKANEAPVRLVVAGLGRAEDYDALGDISGANVLVQRGEITFTDKYQKAVKHGAAGVIVYDNVESDDLVGMAGLEQATIPVTFVGKTDGEQLAKLAMEHGGRRQICV